VSALFPTVHLLHRMLFPDAEPPFLRAILPIRWECPVPSILGLWLVIRQRHDIYFLAWTSLHTTRRRSLLQLNSASSPTGCLVHCPRARLRRSGEQLVERLHVICESRCMLLAQPRHALIVRRLGLRGAFGELLHDLAGVHLDAL